MAKEIRLPQLGQTMEEGTIVNCLVKVGDEVKRGDVIFEIETDKATLEMESPLGGFVKHILAEVDQTLPIGAPMMVVGDKDEQVPQSYVDALTGGRTPASGAPAATAQAPAPATPEPAVAQPSKPGKVMASPRAKKLAQELGVDLAGIKGTGPAGKITEVDVRNAAEAKPAAATAGCSGASIARATPTSWVAGHRWASDT